MSTPENPRQPKRGAAIRPANRFFSTFNEPDFDLDQDAEPSPRTQIIEDHARTIITRNASPDIGFEFSVNPYRGCEHGCSYCYARPTHETFGYDAGLDFESKIIVKKQAPILLRKELAKKSWRPATIVMSGVTDCYQPLERRFRLTRGCLEVLRDFRNPAAIITKNVLLLRDIDLLAEMAALNLIRVNISVTTLNEELSRRMEPRTPLPASRLEAIRRLTERGIKVGVLVAPIVPGLTEIEIPAILEAAAEAGAASAWYTLLRLPLSVKPIFLDWLERNYPEKKSRVESLLRDMRGGELNDASFENRMHGKGPYADHIEATFRLFSQRFGLNGHLPPLTTKLFRNPDKLQQVELFPDDL